MREWVAAEEKAETKRIMLAVADVVRERGLGTAEALAPLVMRKLKGNGRPDVVLHTIEALLTMWQGVKP